MNTLKTIFLPLLLCSYIYSQTSGTYYENPSDIQEIERYYDNTYKYNRDYPVFDNEAWAGKNGEILTMNTFRLIYTWFLNIPSNAIVNSCTLYVSLTSYSNAQPPIVNLQWQIKKFPNDKYTAQPSDQWAAITSADVLRNEVVALNTSLQGSSILDQTFLTYIQNSLSTGKLHISIRGTDEETWATNRNIHYIDFQYSTNPVITALKIKINYTIPAPQIDLTAQNNFIYGKINVGVNAPATERDSPFLIQNTVIGQTVNLVAKNQPYAGYERVWNNYAPTAQSNWTKNGSLVWPNIDYSFQVTQSDDDATYQANLRKNFKIDQTHKTEFDGNQTQQNTAWIVEQNSGNISAQSSRLINGKTYLFAGWEDNLSLPTSRNITPTDNKIYNVLYKYPNHSNNTNAYSSNSQRKLVRTTDGKLHKVYSSMGYVWYEMSTDNGATWSVQNYGKPLSSNEAKLPAIDFMGSEIIIVWQEKYNYYGFDTYKIRLAHYQRPGSQLVFYDVYDPSYIIYPYTPPYSNNTTPVIAWGNYRVLVSWDSGYELLFRNGYANCYDPTTWYNPAEGDWVTGTDENSLNPTIAIRKDGGTTVFHLAWQQSTTAIKYRSLTVNGTNIIVSPEEIPSNGDAVSYKRDPSVAVIGTGVTLVWVGSTYQGATTQVYRRSRSSSWGSFNIYGTNAESPTEYSSRVVWSENNINKLYHPWKGFRTLSTVGKSVQMTTGTMYAVAYRQFSPYDFQTSPNIETIPKLNSFVNKCGREGIAAKGEAEFYFILGDVFVGDEVINFPETADTTSITNIEDLNEYMQTNTFSIDESSAFTFSIAYGTADSLKALNELTGDSRIQFNLELVDGVTNELIGELDDFILDAENMFTYQIHSYQVNTQGLGNRTIRLRITTSTNFDGAYYLANILTEEEVLGKRDFEELNLSDKTIVASYGLFQNYPNPFNPSTTIKYQLPEDGMVTLKVFDILGKEVRSLVNEQQSEGKYEVNLAANDLASGVYIYQLQVNDFISSKKMILMK